MVLFDVNCNCVLCEFKKKMVYQSSNARAMSKSIQATGKQAQSHQLHTEENNKRMLSSVASTKASASAPHYSRMTNENANVKSQCRRESQSNQNPLYRSESSRGQQFMASGAKCRNDHKNDSYLRDEHHDNRLNNEQRHNGATLTDIYADDLSEVIMQTKHSISNVKYSLKNERLWSHPM